MWMIKICLIQIVDFYSSVEDVRFDENTVDLATVPHSCFLRLWLISYKLDKDTQTKIASPMKTIHLKQNFCSTFRFILY